MATGLRVEGRGDEGRDAHDTDLESRDAGDRVRHYPDGTAWLDCPRPDCDGQIEVEFEIEPGEEPVYYPNDRAHPGSPAVALLIGEGGRRDFCECELTDAEWDVLEEDNQERMFEEVR